MSGTTTIESIDKLVLGVLTAKQAWHYRVIPFKVADRAVTCYSEENREDLVAGEELELLTGKRFSFIKRPAKIIEHLLEGHYPQTGQDSRLQSSFYTGNADSFLSNLIGEARHLQSSDIHIETYEERCRVRLRIDGMLVQRYAVEKSRYPSLINKIKIMSNLDIAEKRLPQDGRIFFEQQGHKFDIRVSVLPTLHGEKVVLRLLNNDATNIDLSTLGFFKTDLLNYLEGIRKPNGILLISGPTGSGKTTTLYATLKLLNKDTRNILTIEDPIEYTLDGVNQVQLKESIGLTFAAALRNFLRQDPNIIMLGEIRDTETANMAIRAALTGHLVLSTIHTNSAWGTVSRLLDMGIPPFLVANTLNTSVAQRLIRLLCPQCKSEEAFDPGLFPRKFKPYLPVDSHFVSKGCAGCYNTGFRGRKAVYEVLSIDEELSEVIKSGDRNISDLLKQRQIKTLSENAFELFRQGQTSLEEIYSLLVN
jgi:general secretion pathway protein E/type IV pilus assembly protein PilB